MLEALFNPASIAVIGASQDPKKVGYAVLNNLKKYDFRGGLYPVGIAGCGAAGHEQEVSHVDRGAQNAMRRELGDDLLLRHVFTSKVC